MSTAWGRNMAAYSSLSLRASAHPRDVLETVKDLGESRTLRGMQWALGGVLDNRGDVVLKNLQLISGCSEAIS
jgi:hypothetical protein